MQAIKQKILLLLYAGLILSFTYSPLKHRKIFKMSVKEWERIDKKSFEREIRNLYRSQLVASRNNPDGSLTFILTKKGRLKALTYHFQEMRIKKGRWDKKWRIVIFDVPEKLRKGRDLLRRKLKDLGFYELQKSVFVFPYDCKDEVDFVIEFFGLRRYVRFGTLTLIDNDPHLRKIFHLR